MAKGIEGIYWLDLRQETAKVAVLRPSLDLLHRRLCHLEQENFKCLQGMTTGMNLKKKWL
jgi:hypothetical protein